MSKLQILTRHAVGFCHRLAYGLLASLITFIALGVGPQPVRHELVLFYLGKLLNLPIALVEFITDSHSGIELWFDRGLGSPPDKPLLHYLKVSLPTYLVLFYAPTVIRALYRRWRGPRTLAQGPAPAKEG